MAFRSTALAKHIKFNIKDVEEKVKKAKKEKKIFMVLGGYEKIRQSLIDRGWIERIPDDRLLMVPSTSDRYIQALLCKNLSCFFFWQPRYRPVDNIRSVMPAVSSIIRENRLNFTSKDGLNNCAENFHWYHIDGLTDLNHQRSYVLVDKASKEEFSENFKRTAFTNFIMFLNDNRNDFESFFTTADSGISTRIVELVIQNIELIIKIENHDDLDSNFNLFDFSSNILKDLKEMMTKIRQIINGTRKLKFVDDMLVNVCKSQVVSCAEIINAQWPQVKYDGYYNIWIMKPIGTSSGYGVTVVNSESKILQDARMSSRPFIVQKYIGKF